MACSTGHDWDVFADETPTELHHEDCQKTPDSYPTGDAKAVVVRRPSSPPRTASPC